jgi:hypothetical protein
MAGRSSLRLRWVHGPAFYRGTGCVWTHVFQPSSAEQIEGDLTGLGLRELRKD